VIISKEVNDLIRVYKEVLGEKEREVGLMRLGLELLIGNALAKEGVAIDEGVQVSIDNRGVVTFKKDGKEWTPPA
jgi:hypothetical protein